MGGNNVRRRAGREAYSMIACITMSSKSSDGQEPLAAAGCETYKHLNQAVF